MKQLFITLALCVGFMSCSSDDDGESGNPVTNIEIPQSSSDNPAKAGETVTINGKGFIESSEIWLRAITKSSDSEVKAEITSVTSTGISFIAPEVSGERGIILKQSGQEYTIGKMYFESDDTTEPTVKKRVVKWEYDDNELFYEFKYNKQGRLEEFNDAGELHKFVYNEAGQLVTETCYHYETKEKTSTRTFKYNSSTSILVTQVHHEYAETYTEALTLNGKGLLIKKLNDSDNYTYEYDQKGNLIKIEEEISGDEFTYTYDTKNSYFLNQGLPGWYWVYDDGIGRDCWGGPNNMIKGFAKDGGTLITMTTFKYDYDEDGYPTVIYEDEDDDEDFVEQFKLTYEFVK